ncbi:MAG: BON domain-containing protein [Acidobacteria bacterium]|nr:BON domain-containing protein [Acidobacteriota bacterium]
MKKSIMLLTSVLAITFFATLPALAQQKTDPQEIRKTTEKIRKELVMLPFFSVFDNLEYKFEDGIVTLTGQVVRPILKEDAGKVVAKVEGVDKVVNRIEVLPLSNFDDRIRIAAYRAIYRQLGLDRLAIQAVPPIHIIVRNGHVTLEGVAPSKTDSTRAFLAVNGLPNVFSVKNNLRIEQD